MSNHLPSTHLLALPEVRLYRDLGYTSSLGLKTAQLIMLMDTDIQGHRHTTDHVLISTYQLFIHQIQKKITFPINIHLVKLILSTNAIFSEVTFSCEVDGNLQCHFQ